MNEKFDFFKSLYEGSLLEQERIQTDFLNYAKFSPLLLGLSFFFFQSKKSPIILYGEHIEFYNLILLFNFTCFLIFIFLTWWGVALRPKTSILSSPKQLADHWDALAIANTGNDSAQFQTSILPKYIEAAEHNDSNNIKRSKLKRIAGVAMLGVLSSYVILAIM